MVGWGARPPRKNASRGLQGALIAPWVGRGHLPRARPALSERVTYAAAQGGCRGVRRDTRRCEPCPRANTTCAPGGTRVRNLVHVLFALERNAAILASGFSPSEAATAPDDAMGKAGRTACPHSTGQERRQYVRWPKFADRRRKGKRLAERVPPL